MRVTIQDLIAAEARLSVRCLNCGHVGVVTPQFIAHKVGESRDVTTIRYRCFNGCETRRVELRLALGKFRFETRGTQGTKGFY